MCIRDRRKAMCVCVCVCVWDRFKNIRRKLCQRRTAGGTPAMTSLRGSLSRCFLPLTHAKRQSPIGCVRRRDKISAAAERRGDTVHWRHRGDSRHTTGQPHAAGSVTSRGCPLSVSRSISGLSLARGECMITYGVLSENSSSPLSRLRLSLNPAVYPRPL